MWETKTRTPYAVGHAWGRNQDGVHEWIVAVRATFDLKSNGKVLLADEQPAPVLVPEYNGEDGLSSLRCEADVVSGKPATDVILNGTAYAPQGKPAREFEVGMQVDGVQKRLRVIGERIWVRGPAGLSPSATVPVAELPIVYERAYGGYDASHPDVTKHKLDVRNPVGRGVTISSDRLLDQPLHNFEYPGGSAEKAGPAGFGTIAASWAPRIHLQGTYDAAWEKNRRPLLPSDWDPKSTLCSPADQRPSTHLHGGERVQLLNLTREGFLQFDLPKIYLTFTTVFSAPSGRRTEEHRSRLSTVRIEPDTMRLSMVWVSTLLVHEHEDYLDQTMVREKPYV